MECANQKVDVAGVSTLTVGDVMQARPKRLAADATAADLRRLFANEDVRTALVVEGGVFFGSIERDELDANVPEGARARDVAHPEVATIQPQASAADAVKRLDEMGAWRLASSARTAPSKACSASTAAGPASAAETLGIGADVG